MNVATYNRITNHKDFDSYWQKAYFERVSSQSFYFNSVYHHLRNPGVCHVLALLLSLSFSTSSPPSRSFHSLLPPSLSLSLVMKRNPNRSCVMCQLSFFLLLGLDRLGPIFVTFILVITQYCIIPFIGNFKVMKKKKTPITVLARTGLTNVQQDQSKYI